MPASIITIYSHGYIADEPGAGEHEGTKLLERLRAAKAALCDAQPMVACHSHNKTAGSELSVAANKLKATLNVPVGIFEIGIQRPVEACASNEHWVEWSVIVL